MSLEISTIRPFGETALELLVISDETANGQKELNNILESLERFYIRYAKSSNIDLRIKTSAPKEFLYWVLDGSDYIGAVKITVQGCDVKVDARPKEDYAIGRSTYYFERYVLNFFPKDKTERTEQRDAYAKFLDPFRDKTVEKKKKYYRRDA